MQEKMGIENGYALNMAKMASIDAASYALAAVHHQTSPKRKVGRPITSAKTMNRYFVPAHSHLFTNRS